MRKKFLFLLGCLLAGASLSAQIQKFTVVEDIAGGGKATNMSFNGQYVVGVNPTYIYSSFIWDVTNSNEAEWVTDQNAGLDQEGTFTAISNNKVAAGYYRSDEFTIIEDEQSYPTPVAAIWKDGVKTSLGIGTLTSNQYGNDGDGSYATSISSDGNIVGGYLSANQQSNLTPIVWKYNETNNSWNYEIYKVPTGATGGGIYAISGDGSIAVGFLSYNLRTLPVYWTSKDEVMIIQQLEAGQTPKEPLEFPEHTFGACYYISENGQAISLLTDLDAPAFYYLDHVDYGTAFNKVLDEDLPEYIVSAYAGVVTDKGTPFFTYVMNDPLRGEYSQTLFRHFTDYGYHDFSIYVDLFASEVNIPEEISFYGESGQTTQILAAAGDGNTLLGSTNGYTWVLQTPYDEYAFLPSKPFNGLTAELTGFKEVSLQFKGDYGSIMGYELAGFNIYRNGQLVTFIPTNEGQEDDLYTFTDNEASGITTGYNNYSISTVWEVSEDGGGSGIGGGPAIAQLSANSEEGLIESERSEVQTVVVAPTFDLPFFDDLESMSIRTNYWSPVSESAGNERFYWGVGDYLGINASYAINIGVSTDSYYDESLVSRHMDATNLEDVYINYMINHEFYYLGENTPAFAKDQDFLYVEVLPEGSNEWIIVKTHSPATDPFFKWQNQLIDISKHVKNKLFQVRFHIKGAAEAKVIWYLDQIKVSGDDPEKEAPEKIRGNAGNGGVQLYWTNTVNAFELTHATDALNGNVFFRAIGNENKRFIAANLFDKEDLRDFDGMYLTSVNVYINESVEGSKTDFNLVIYENDEQVVKQAVSSYIPNAYNTFYLTEANIRQIDYNKVLKVGIELGQHNPNDLPIAYQNTYDAIPGKTDLYASAETNWEWASLKDFYEEEAKLYPSEKQQEIRDYGYCIWDISANITEEKEVDSTVKRDNTLFTYDVLRDGVQINELPIYNAQPKFIDKDPSGKMSCYTVRAYYLDGSISELSPEFCFDTTNIEENTLEETVNIYPNPVTDYIYINVNIKSATLININGQTILETTNNPIEVSNIAAGIYFLKVDTGNEIITKKLIKK